MKGYKYLAKNMGLLTISNFGTKLLSFLLVPLYTNILSTSEYGTYDLISTTISILVPFLTLNIMESVLRFTMEEDSNDIGILSISFRFFIGGFFPLAILIGINYIFNFIPLFRDYALLFLLLYFFSALSGIMTSFARGLEQIIDISISGILCSVTIIGLNIFLLVVMEWGIPGYFIANIVGIATQGIYLLIRTKAWNYISLKYSNKKLQKSMLDYCKPLIANSVAWWVNNASDRYIVTWICGIAENGIYSVGYKIPSILNIFQTIFNQAWTLSAVKDFDPEDKNGFFSNMYNSYNCLMVFLCSGLILIDKPLAKILYAKDFYEAWKYVPFLLIAIVFGALSGYIGGIFSAVKNSKIFAQSTIVGAVCNIIMNFIFVSWIGALGAAIATAVSYWIVWCIRIIHMKKYMNIRLHLVRDYLSYLILVIQALMVLLLLDSIHLYVAEVFAVILIAVLYIREVKLVLNKLLRRIKR